MNDACLDALTIFLINLRNPALKNFSNYLEYIFKCVDNKHNATLIYGYTYSNTY